MQRSIAHPQISQRWDATLIDSWLERLISWCEHQRSARTRRAATHTLRSWSADLARETARFGQSAQRWIGVRPIEVARILGSVGSAAEIDGAFQPLSLDPTVLSRYRSVLRAMRAGDDLQPIVVYKLRRAYYVVDGRNRAGAAKRIGWDTIAADVTVFLPDGDHDELALFHERQAFEAATELLLIEAALPGTYPALRADIEWHTAQPQHNDLQGLAVEEAALRWYYRRFLPGVELIRGSRFRRLAPGLCSADILALLLAAEHHATPALDTGQPA